MRYIPSFSCVFLAALVSLMANPPAQAQQRQPAVFFLTTSPTNKSSTNNPSTSSSGRYVQTTALLIELQQANTKLNSIASRLQRLETSLRNARGKVQSASNVTRATASIDNELVRLIRQLDPISKLPPTRGLRVVVMSLEKIRTQVHRVRVQGDRVDRTVLKPLARRIRAMETKIAGVRAYCYKLVRTNTEVQGHVRSVQAFVESQGNISFAVSQVESASRTARSALNPLTTALNAIDRNSAAVERDINGMAADLNGIINAGKGIARLQRDLAPIDRKARDLDRVLSKRITIKVLKVGGSFTIRQVIEAPGKIADIILRPLEKIASKALSPLTRALNLEIRAPREIRELGDRLNSINARAQNLNRTLASLERDLQTRALAEFERALGRLRSLATSSLARQ